MDPLSTSLGEGIEMIGSAIIVVGIIVAVMWRSNTKDKHRQETLRMLLEKGHDLQDPEVAKLINPSTPRGMDTNPGDAYKGFQIGGLITIACGAGVAVMFLFISQTTENPVELTFVGMGIGALLLIIGLGLLVCTRFVNKPPEQIQIPVDRDR